MNFQDFLNSYPEFVGISENSFNSVLGQVECLFPQYFQTNSLCYQTILGSLLVAHFLVIGGYGVSVGLNKPSGLVLSSTVGGVSISMQSAPVNNMVDYYFSSTPYGLRYLAYLNNISGLSYVN